MVTNGLALIGIGLLIGGALSAVLVGWLRGSLLGASAGDPWTLLAAIIVLPVVAVLAAWLPARKAARVDLASLLR